jgi:hypothetical protein
MMLGSKLAAFAGVLIFAGSAFSAQQAICPDINDIKAAGISMAEEFSPKVYFTYNISLYNTPPTYKLWGFFIEPVEGDSDVAAIETANEILSTMTAPGVPEQNRNSNTIICIYDTGRQDVFAAAFNDIQISPMKLKQYFLKAH